MRIFVGMYKILRTLLFFFPAEGVHHFSMKGLKMLCGWAVTRRLVTWACRPEDSAGGRAAAPAASSGAAGGAAGGAAVSSGAAAGGTAVSGTAVSGGAAGSAVAGGRAAGGGGTVDGKGTGLARTVLGLSFPNPVGLGAGFDKNALYLRELAALGFGFVEIGTVTPKSQAGNDQPRLFRLPQDQALINRMGFNNDGVDVISVRLKAWRDSQGSHGFGASGVRAGASGVGGGASGVREDAHDNAGPGSRLIIGGNIGKNKVTPNEEAWKDYDICFRALYDYVDYFVVNVSSPNTPGLRELQEKDALRLILTNLQQIAAGFVTAGRPRRPLLLKIAPDLTPEQLDDVVSLALEIELDGLVATNTTISRENLLTPADRIDAIGAGGLSGAPIRQRSTEIVRYLAEKTHGRIPIIASGGIFTVTDAREKLAAGAVLVQVWTGFIYEGPFIVNRICQDLPD